MKVLFIAPYPSGEAPSQRFRFEQYLDILSKAGIDWEVRSFYSESAWKIIYQDGRSTSKIWFVLLGFARRSWQLFFTVPGFDLVFIHREATPLGPPWFEWFSSRVFGKKIIFDLDDSIWIRDRSVVNKGLDWLKWRRKFRSVIKWSWKISAGNEYLADYCRNFNPHVQVNPTTVDTENLHDPSLYAPPAKDLITVGWTGTHSTSKYVSKLIPELDGLHKRTPFRFLYISNRPPDHIAPWLEYRPWNAATEIPDLLEIDLGIMPLEDDEWCKGKCGLKLIQYLSLGIPALASPVGVNPVILTEGLHGEFARTQTEFVERIARILGSPGKLDSYRNGARQDMIDRFSVRSNRDNFLSLFRSPI